MTPFECVPNFSEGRDAEKVHRIADAARTTVGVTVLDVEMNADHNRCVISLYGDGEPLVEAVFRMMEVATRSIDLTHHVGEHPRMGATDVVPFVPVGAATTMDEAVRLAERLGERVARELAIPVYLYGKAARRPERADLAKVREGQFEGIREEIARRPERAPDFGAARVHPTAGAVAIGARPVLIAYNVLLQSPDVAVAKAIAKSVRARDGGLPEVKALGFEIAERHRAQVSMNLTDYRTTSIFAAFGAVRDAAAARGTEVEESEIVGLVPDDALLDAAEAALRLAGFDRSRILERQVADAEAHRPGHESIASFSARLAARTPTPGGGSAAAVVAVLACALGEMVLAYSVDPAKPDDELRTLARDLAEARQAFLLLADQDAASYDGVRAAKKALRVAPADAPLKEAYVAAVQHAAEVPLETGRRAHELAVRLASVKDRTKAALVSDLTTALACFRAASEGALANVGVNLVDLRAAGASVESYERALDQLRRGA